MVKRHQKNADIKLYKYIRSATFQRTFAFIIMIVVLFIMVSYEATPKKYKLEEDDISAYDINAPRDIENTIKTRRNAEQKASMLEPVVIKNEKANSDMLNNTYDYFDSLEKLVDEVRRNVGTAAIADLIHQSDPTNRFSILLQLPQDKLDALFTDQGAAKVVQLGRLLIKEVLPALLQKTLMEGNLTSERNLAVDQIRGNPDVADLTEIGNDVLKSVLKANSAIDEEKTSEEKAAFIESYIKDNPVIIYEGERIISKDDVVTDDKYEVLKELNYIDSEGQMDYLLYLAVLLLILALAALSILYLRNFHPKLYFDKNSAMLICVAILATSLFSWVIREFVPEYAYLIMPVFIAPVVIAIFLGIEPAITINLLLTFSYCLMLGGNLQFVLMSVIGGTFAAYLTVNATQRRRISLAGVILGGINALVIVLSGIIEKKGAEALLNEGGLAFVNGIFSMILAVGLLPFLESTFNVVTPMKLLELADPNHPLLKRLLMEAPGTYHHSLMVGNLAEVATREIGGNSLLARVGAYFHDVGKLKRPQFFKENQMAENPHDKLTPNLSTLVITSHTRDGEELALKYRLPRVIRDMIAQHHGTTLVAYFYHKAVQNQSDKAEDLKESSFRYEGPLPDTRESAVVLLADSVEAAVRAMNEKTKGKIEGLVRKIIKDKLDDGQLNRCDLTLKDLSIIADSFMQVLSGIFHERPEYPELEKRNTLQELDQSAYNVPKDAKKDGGKKADESHALQQTEEGPAIAGEP